MSTSHTATFLMNGKNVTVDIFKLRPLSANVPVISMPLEFFRGAVEDTEDNKGWMLDNGIRFGPASLLRPLRSITEPHLLKELVRVRKADLSFPIWMHEEGVFDGLHRLTKAFLLKRTEIFVQKWEVIPDEAIIKGF